MTNKPHSIKPIIICGVVILGAIMLCLIFGVKLFPTEPAAIETPSTVTETRVPTQGIAILIGENEVILYKYPKPGEEAQADTLRQTDEQFKQHFIDGLNEMIAGEPDFVNNGQWLSVKAPADMSFDTVNRIFEILRESGYDKFTLMTSLKNTEESTDD